MRYLFGFIGCGNMGGTLARVAAKKIGGDKVAVADFDASKTAAIHDELGAVVLSAEEIAKVCKFVVLGVKPQALDGVFTTLAPALKENSDVTLITMAAGVSIAALRQKAGFEYPTIRIMPNTPCGLGAGVIAYTPDGVSQANEATFLEAFSNSGLIDKTTEDKLDAVTALTGSGPAFVYLFAAALAKGGEECGLEKDASLSYVAKTLEGAAKMLQKYGDAETLCKNVCSPNGTTIEGVNTLREQNFEEISASAIKAAYRRALELKSNS
ncbi:MAG: pyrroline-5-carboxylate reductase [Clostridia bacterium]|nr:pyrroline-5-carboxylate reductase [Clostridia bacterium]